MWVYVLICISYGMLWLDIIPLHIIIDIFSNFTSEVFQYFYEAWNNLIAYASTAHPHANGQAERANDAILQEVKQYNMKLRDTPEGGPSSYLRYSGVFGLPLVAQPATLPFFKVYNAEVVPPIDINFNSLRICNLHYKEDKFEAARQDAVDQVIPRSLGIVPVFNMKYLTMINSQ